MNTPAITRGIYRHYKGNHYQVLDVVRHSETEEWLVLYKALYNDYSLWVRPIKMFNENVLVNGRQTARFELVQALEAER